MVVEVTHGGGFRDNLAQNENIKGNTALLEELREKLPQFFTADKYDDNGELVRPGSFDMNKFQDSLKENDINELSSGYQLDFIGKNYAKKQAGERPVTVIVPDVTHNSKPENSNSKNLFFTGDNLEVLRHLQQNYANSIDIIYIDPPYNTGSDGFVYPDKFEYSDEQLKDQFGLNDDELTKLKSIQGKSSHAAWLTFMYPRLYLAKKMLKESGVIFVSIDDNEQANLKLLLDDIFGENEFVSNIIWQSTGGSNTGSKLITVTENILLYGKNANNIDFRLEMKNGNYRLEDEYVSTRGKYERQKLDGTFTADHFSSSLVYPIILPNGNEIYPGGGSQPNERWNWRWSRSKVEWGLENGFIDFVERDGSWTVYFKNYEFVDNTGSPRVGSVPPKNMIGTDISTTSTGSNEVNALLGQSVFDFPKSTKLLKHVLGLIDKTEYTVMDFFAGSGTTADAVMQLNAEDNGNRKFLLVQLPELTKIGSVPHNNGYLSIDEISRKRITKAAEKISASLGSDARAIDLGFKHYRVVEPKQQAIDEFEFSESTQLGFFDDMISQFSSDYLEIPGEATGLDSILATYLAADNYKFDTEIEHLNIGGVTVAYVNKNRLYLITDVWNVEQTRQLTNDIGTGKLQVQTIVVYGYTMPMEALRELEIGLKQLEVKVNLQVRY